MPVVNLQMAHLHVDDVFNRKDAVQQALHRLQVLCRGLRRGVPSCDTLRENSSHGSRQVWHAHIRLRQKACKCLLHICVVPASQNFGLSDSRLHVSGPVRCCAGVSPSNCALPRLQPLQLQDVIHKSSYARRLAHVSFTSAWYLQARVSLSDSSSHVSGPVQGCARASPSSCALPRLQLQDVIHKSGCTGRLAEVPFTSA